MYGTQGFIHNQLIQKCNEFHKSLIVIHLVKNFPDFREPKMDYRVHKIPLLYQILAQLNSALIFTSSLPKIQFNIVTCVLKAGIAEPEETAVARERLPRQRMHERNNRGTAGSGVFSWVCPDAI
jgi:hypothetical protein